MSSQTVFRLAHRNGFSGFQPRSEPIPEIESHELLIKVRSVTLNFRDIAISTSKYPSLATVHIAFTAAIVHLADMKLEEPSYQQQATRGFTTCVDALEEIKYTWSAWSVKGITGNP